MPRISAIITTWNRSALLRGAIESVLAQTFEDFELLILDNNSTDDTEAVVKSFRDTRIRSIRHQPLGISQGRNLGIKEAVGNFVGFLDDDDVWLPDKLAKQLALFQGAHDDVGMVYGGFHRITEEGAIYATVTPTLRGDALVGYLCGRDPLTGSASNPIIRAEVFKRIGGYNESLKTSEDWEFYLRLMRMFTIDFVPEPLLKIRRHAGARLGDRFLDAAAAELLVIQEFADVLKNHHRCLSQYLQAVGGKYCRAGDSKAGRKYLRQALAANFLNGTAYLQYALSFLGTAQYRKVHTLYKQWH